MLIFEEESGALGGGLVGRRRRRWSEAQKRQIVAETQEPGVSVPMVAQRYNLNANQVFRWRRLFREPERAGGAGRLVPVVVEATLGREPDAATMSPPSESVVAAGRPRDRGYGHAARHEHAGPAGTAGPRARPPCGGSLCLPRTQRRSREDSLDRRYRDIALHEASGAWPVSVAICGGRSGIDQRGAARLPAGGDRVAQPGSDLAAVAGGLSCATRWPGRPAPARNCREAVDVIRSRP